MGTIGHQTLLYDLTNWQIRAAIRGYYRNQRPIFEAARMLGLWTVSCQRSHNAPPLTLTDLVEFPWERENNKINEEEDKEALARLLEEARRHNARLMKEQP